MQTNNNDFKYVLQNTMYVYIGAKYTYEEILKADEVPFKFQTIVGQYVSKDEVLSLTMEEHLKQMKKTDMTFLVWKQLKAKVKTTSKVFTIEEFVDRIQEGEDYFVDEMIFPKFSLMAFSI